MTLFYKKSTNLKPSQEKTGVFGTKLSLWIMMNPKTHFELIQTNF